MMTGTNGRLGKMPSRGTMMGPGEVHRGFTLIELMVAVVIVAILASIAVPSYNESVRKSRRAQAKADLLELAQMAERHFTVNTSYQNFSVPSGMENSPRGGGAVSYTISSTSDAATFTLTATPVNAQANDRCGTLTVNHQGRRTNSAGEYAECW